MIRRAIRSLRSRIPPGWLGHSPSLYNDRHFRRALAAIRFYAEICARAADQRAAREGE